MKTPGSGGIDCFEFEKSSFETLLAAARAGDAVALGRLLQWYANYLGFIANMKLDRRLRRRLNPSDIVQETMLAAHRDFGDFRGQTQAELLCWLRTILIHVLHRSFDRNVKVGKRDIRREVSFDDLGNNHETSDVRFEALIPARGETPSAHVRAKESDLELARQLSVLKPEYQQVITLRVVHGFSFDEISSKMGRSCGAVRMLWLRALDAFKAQNGELYGGSR